GLLIASATLIFTSCQKDGMKSGNEDLTPAMNEAKVMGESAKIDDIVNLVIYNSDLTRGLFTQLPACATITYDTLSTPKSITVDFATTPCFTEWDSSYREGVIKVTWTGDRKVTGSVWTISTLNYFVGPAVDQLNKFDYAKTTTNMGANASGNLHFSISVPTATVTLFDGGIITWTASYDREWVE